jgi:hypothetical protein
MQRWFSHRSECNRKKLLTREKRAIPNANARQLVVSLCKVTASTSSTEGGHIFFAVDLQCENDGQAKEKAFLQFIACRPSSSGRQALRREVCQSKVGGANVRRASKAARLWFAFCSLGKTFLEFNQGRLRKQERAVNAERSRRATNCPTTTTFDQQNAKCLWISKRTERWSSLAETKSNSGAH